MILILFAALLLQPFDVSRPTVSGPRLAQDKQAATGERELQRIAIEGWTAARELAPKGGAIEFLGPVNLQLKALDAFPDTAARYAEIAIRAAVSAAQEERDELGLLLDIRETSATRCR